MWRLFGGSVYVQKCTPVPHHTPARPWTIYIQAVPQEKNTTLHFMPRWICQKACPINSLNWVSNLNITRWFCRHISIPFKKVVIFLIYQTTSFKRNFSGVFYTPQKLFCFCSQSAGTTQQFWVRDSLQDFCENLCQSTGLLWFFFCWSPVFWQKKIIEVLYFGT